jgi:polysaccharide biosynthesis protein PslH
MRFLWVTLADPDPGYGGQLIYSGGLIQSVAAQGADINVIGQSRPDARRRDGMREGRVTWHLAEPLPYSRLTSLTSTLPSQAFRGGSAAMYARLAKLLEERSWDVVVFDSLCSGWALKNVLTHYARDSRRPRFVYISHNHEESVRRRLIANHPHWPRRQMLRIDGYRVIRLDRALVAIADLVTTITPEDRELYLKRWPQKRFEVLTPGYAGRILARRRLGDDIPRRAVVLGTFDWIAKRLNLEEFVRVADPMFAAASAELHIVGNAEPAFLEAMQRGAVATRFVGRVARVDQYMDQSRIALVPERHGGGFKLKVLDYVFNRLPIFALNGSVAGVPLKDGESVQLRPTHERLARGVLDAIEDFDGLNRQQQSAYAACLDKFNWETRGKELAAALATL